MLTQQGSTPIGSISSAKYAHCVGMRTITYSPIWENIKNERLDSKSIPAHQSAPRLLRFGHHIPGWSARTVESHGMPALLPASRHFLHFGHHNPDLSAHIAVSHGVPALLPLRSLVMDTCIIMIFIRKKKLTAHAEQHRNWYFGHNPEKQDCTRVTQIWIIMELYERTKAYRSSRAGETIGAAPLFACSSLN